jgi:hypothetical protein
MLYSDMHVFVPLIIQKDTKMLLETTCKAGKLQVTEDGILRIQVHFSKNVVWQIPCQAIIRFTTQPSTLGVLTLFVHATGAPTYQIETFGERHLPKLHALFPHVIIDKKDKARFWYQDITKRAHVETYQGEKIMQKEVEMAVQYGWTPQTSAGIGGHVSAAKIIAGGMLLGGIGALAGAGRSKDKITITYVRTPEWLAQN